MGAHLLSGSIFPGEASCRTLVLPQFSLEVPHFWGGSKLLEPWLILSSSGAAKDGDSDSEDERNKGKLKTKPGAAAKAAAKSAAIFLEIPYM